MHVFEKIKKQSSTAFRFARLLNMSRYAFVARYIWLSQVKGFSEGEIFAMALMDPALTFNDLQAYISKKNARLVYRALNASKARELIDDKDLFHLMCQEKSLPAVPVIARLTRSKLDAIARQVASGEMDSYLELLNALPHEFVVKPSQGYHGDGILFLKKDAHQNVSTWDGAPLTPQTLLEHFQESISAPTMPLAQGAAPGESRRSSNEHILLFQKLMQAHEHLQRLSGRQQVQSLRICTTLGDSGKATIHFVFLKLLAGKNMQDNFSQGANGNMLAYMSEEHGQITRVICRDSVSGLMRVTSTHPDTKENFLGFKVPFWNEACQLALDAAESFNGTRAVGWDIGLTPDGPMLLEGNGTWDPLAPLYKRFPTPQELAALSKMSAVELNPAKS